MLLEFIGVMAAVIIFIMFMTMRVTWFRLFMMAAVAATYYIANNGGM